MVCLRLLPCEDEMQSQVCKEELEASNKNCSYWAIGHFFASPVVICLMHLISAGIDSSQQVIFKTKELLFSSLTSKSSCWYIHLCFHFKQHVFGRSSLPLQADLVTTRISIPYTFCPLCRYTLCHLRRRKHMHNITKQSEIFQILKIPRLTNLDNETHVHNMHTTTYNLRGRMKRTQANIRRWH